MALLAVLLLSALRRHSINMLEVEDRFILKLGTYNPDVIIV